MRRFLYFLYGVVCYAIFFACGSSLSRLPRKSSTWRDCRRKMRETAR